MTPEEFDGWHMTTALDLAARGRGLVEPNPMVGAVVVRDGVVVGEGWHQKFGGPHAEVAALNSAGSLAAGTTINVTLEPCCHCGKTGPCTQALIRAGVRRVVAAMQDPFAAVAGRGLEELRAAGVDVEVGLLEDAARRLNAPYLKLLASGRPWVIAKWAMSLDGKIATASGDSRWISGQASRRIVHELRGRVDGILVGRGTAASDDPLLTARPAGPRVATRIVVDSKASLSLDSQLVKTAGQAPVLVVVTQAAAREQCDALRAAGCEVWTATGQSPAERIDSLLVELGRGQMTNLLVEGGGQLLGSLLDAGQIDEVSVFIAPKIIGGHGAPAPLAGEGIARLADALRLEDIAWSQVGDDLHLAGRVAR